MQAIEFNSETKELKLIKKPLPTISDSKQVLVKVAFCGICGTDLHIMQGVFPSLKGRPFTLGHEFSGTVTEVGSDVTYVKKGDKVAVDPNHGCGVCKFCRLGKVHFCTIGGINDSIGVWKDGGWAEYALVPEAQIYKLPENTSLEQGALLEPLSCIAHGWDKVSPIKIGEKILILGAGIIGSLWASILHVQGHKDVTISEPTEKKRDLVKRFGYECISPETLEHRRKDPNYLFDVIIDCTGYAPAVEHAFSFLEYGGKLCIFGCSEQGRKISVSPFEIYRKEITIVGVIINPNTFPKAIALVDSMGDRYLSYEKLGVKTFSLSEYKEAFENLKKGTIMKAMFKL